MRSQPHLTPGPRCPLTNRCPPRTPAWASWTTAGAYDGDCNTPNPHNEEQVAVSTPEYTEKKQIHASHNRIPKDMQAQKLAWIMKIISSRRCVRHSAQTCCAAKHKIKRTTDPGTICTTRRQTFPAGRAATSVERRAENYTIKTAFKARESAQDSAHTQTQITKSFCDPQHVAGLHVCRHHPDAACGEPRCSRRTPKSTSLRAEIPRGY